jgi:hypothetical protein
VWQSTTRETIASSAAWAVVVVRRTSAPSTTARKDDGTGFTIARNLVPDYLKRKRVRGYRLSPERCEGAGTVNADCGCPALRRKESIGGEQRVIRRCIAVAIRPTVIDAYVVEVGHRASALHNQISQAEDGFVRRRLQSVCRPATRTY